LIRNNIFVKPDKGQWDREIEADMLASLIALRKAMAKHPIRHAVSFHASIQRAGLFKMHNEAFTRAFPEYGDLETFHVSGRTPTGTRARIIGDFARTKRALITNARCLNEGVDVPDIDGVLFADPRRSAVDIVQAVGRALRPALGKQFGYVIVPVLHDADATEEDICESGAFQEVLTTLRALGANDDRIIEFFKTVSEGRQRRGGMSVEIELDERLAQRIDVLSFTRAIELRCWDRLAKLSWRNFEEARAFARNLNLKSYIAWRAFSKGEMTRLGRLPADIPAFPNETYADRGWKGYGDWLGTGIIAPHLREYRPFHEARAFAANLKLKSSTEWQAFCKGEMPKLGRLPVNIPSNPNNTYADKGWKGMGDWLGTGTIAPHLREYRSFREARAFVRKLTLKNVPEWRTFCKSEMPGLARLPADIPVAPEQQYTDKGWIGWGDWLGTGNVSNARRQFRPFHEARMFARQLKLKSGTEWRAFYKGKIPKLGRLPADIPAAPSRTYADKGWKGMGDWLGTGNIAPYLREYRPFREARTFVRNLKLKSGSEWLSFRLGKMPKVGRLPADIPTNPEKTYADKGWKGMGDWLGTGNIAPSLREYRPFLQARAFGRRLKLKNLKEWRAFCKGEMPGLGRLPADIPSKPSRTYADKGWKGLGDWLGTGNISNRLKKYRSFQEARAFARDLKLKGQGAWRAFCKGEMPKLGRLPTDIPANPNGTYADKGWKGMGDWLGTGGTREPKQQSPTVQKRRHGTDGRT
jgi:Helicase conserved C-terminal domain/Phage-integrase repeat unit